MEEAEQQRREKNREYNRTRLLNSLNVLTVNGRSLIDNALDFGELRTLTNSRGKSPIDKLLNVGYAFDYVTSSFFNINVAEDNSQQVFYDSHLIDTTTFLSFSKDPKVALNFLNKDKLKPNCCKVLFKIHPVEDKDKQWKVINEETGENKK